MLLITSWITVYKHAIMNDREFMSTTFVSRAAGIITQGKKNVSHLKCKGNRHAKLSIFKKARLLRNLV